MSLSVEYMGLKLRNPIIIGSSGLSKNIEGVKKLYENGAGAIVLKSLFEEQIIAEATKGVLQVPNNHTEMYDYIKNYTRENSIDDYLDLIKKSKESTTIPIIASINCVSNTEWISFAKKIQNSGADALELNISFLPSDDSINSKSIEKKYFEIVKRVKKQISIPLSLKMSYFSAGLSNLIKELSWTNNIDSFILFNRFYSPDIDIDTFKFRAANTFSQSSELTTSLRWIALLSNKINKPLIPSTGIHTAEDVIKQILVGAQAVQIVSSIYKNGAEQIPVILEDLKKWMQKNNYNSLNDFRGKLHYQNTNNEQFERIQFMKYYGGIE